jgi:PAS domain
MAVYKEVFDSAPDAIIVTDREGNIVQVNPQTEILFGYTSDELLGQSAEVLVPERAHRPSLQDPVQRARKGCPIKQNIGFGPGMGIALFRPKTIEGSLGGEKRGSACHRSPSAEPRTEETVKTCAVLTPRLGQRLAPPCPGFKGKVSSNPENCGRNLFPSLNNPDGRATRSRQRFPIETSIARCVPYALHLVSTSDLG